MSDAKTKHNREKPYWLFLHPYVHVSVKKDRAVLYNTLNHKLLEYRCDSPAYPLIKRLNSDYNLYVIKLKEMDIQGETGDFVHKVREGFFGDIMDTRLSDKKPFQWKPILNLQPTLDSLTIGDEKSRSLSQDDIPDYLNVLTLYLNGTCGQNCTICPDAYKQFPCCTKTVQGGFATSNRHKKKSRDCRLTIGDIDLMLRQSVNSNLHMLYIAQINCPAFAHLNWPSHSLCQ